MHQVVDSVQLYSNFTGNHQSSHSGKRMKRKAWGSFKKEFRGMAGNFETSAAVEDTVVFSSADSDCVFTRMEKRFVQPDANGSLLRMLVQDQDGGSSEEVMRRFQAIPEKILRRCIEFGTRFYVEDPANLRFGIDLIPPEFYYLCGVYIPRLKACYLRPDALRHPALARLPLILLSHAFDHVLGQDNFASSRSLVLNLFLECQKGKDGRQFMSPYGKAGPVQYFADSMASYYLMDDDVQGRKMLEMIDEPMVLFLEALFKTVR